MAESRGPRGLTRRQAAVKRTFDVVTAFVGLVVTSPLVAVGWLAATLSTRQNGLFRQERVGLHGEPFVVLKLRTMRSVPGQHSTVTARGDVRITRTGAWLRRFKIDELPQLLNVLRGEMSLVGPRPDVPGFADLLVGDDRVVLTVRPGVTGPAALAYLHEEQILSAVPDPERHNRDVIWPEKVRINRRYVETWTFRGDLACLWATVRSAGSRSPDPVKEVVP